MAVVLAFLILAVLDAAALLVAAGWIGAGGFPPIAAGATCHGLAVVLAFIAGFLSKKSRHRPGFLTLVCFAASTAALTPVLGFLAAALLLSPRMGHRRRGSPLAGIRFGNPLAEFRRGARPTPTPHSQPLAVALQPGHRTLQRNAAPILRSIGGRRSALILRDLVNAPDARAHLYAQAALATLQEAAEARVKRLRRDVEAAPESLDLRERLAAAILAAGELSPDEGRAASYPDAMAQFERALAIEPNDAACLYGKARCLITKGDLDPVPDLYGRLCAISGATHHADRVELAYFAAMGNWTRVADAVKRISQEPASRDLGAECRRFWLTVRPTHAALS